MAFSDHRDTNQGYPLEAMWEEELGDRHKGSRILLLLDFVIFLGGHFLLVLRLHLLYCWC